MSKRKETIVRILKENNNTLNLKAAQEIAGALYEDKERARAYTQGFMDVVELLIADGEARDEENANNEPDKDDNVRQD